MGNLAVAAQGTRTAAFAQAHVVIRQDNRLPVAIELGFEQLRRPNAHLCGERLAELGRFQLAAAPYRVALEC